MIKSVQAAQDETNSCTIPTNIHFKVSLPYQHQHLNDFNVVFASAAQFVDRSRDAKPVLCELRPSGGNQQRQEALRATRRAKLHTAGCIAQCNCWSYRLKWCFCFGSAASHSGKARVEGTHLTSFVRGSEPVCLTRYRRS